MTMRAKCGIVGLAAVLIAISSVSSAQGITVLVDDQVLRTSAAPTEVGGRILVGMRDIFERLGATVAWSAAEQKITAERGARIVTLWIGRRYAMVDGTTLPLDVPPQLIGGYTYVPVRFPSEALGANVSWMSATRTVMISTENMPAIDEQVEPPLPPPPPAPTEVRGTLVQFVVATPRAILVEVYDSGNAETYVATEATVYQRGDADATVLRIVNPDEVIPGDDVALFLNADRTVERLEARYAMAQVKYQAAAANSLLSDIGDVYHLAADVTLTRTDKGEITLADLRVGEEIRLRQNPVTREVWEVIAPPTEEPPPPPPPDEGPKILLIAPGGYTKPLQLGEALKVRMQGTPGGQATFDIGAEHTGLTMTEKRAGVYRGEYQVRRNEEIVDALLSGHLTVGEKQADPAEAHDRVSLDSVDPTVTDFLPARDATVTTDRPTIQCIYDDGDGVGVNPKSVTLQVKGDDVTPNCIIDANSLTYYSPKLPDGELRLRLSGKDYAGNRLELFWKFTIAAADQQSAITSVSHVPPGVPLGVGDTLTLTLRAEPRGRSASFDIVGLKTGIAMQRQGGVNSRLWQGSYTVQAGDKVNRATIVGHFVDENGKSHEMEDQQRANINAGVKTRLTVTTPADGATVGDVFVLSGTCIPKRKVNYEVTYEGRSQVMGAKTDGKVREGKVKVGDEGKWRVSINTRAARDNPLLRRIDKFNIKCTLRGKGGAIVETVEISVNP